MKPNDLISRSELLKKAVTVQTADGESSQVVSTTDIKKAPAVKIRPREHSQWTYQTRRYKEFFYRCALCDRVIATRLELEDVAKEFPYCHCGAKMFSGNEP